MGYLQANAWGFLAGFLDRHQYVLIIENLLDLSDLSEQWSLLFTVIGEYCVNEL